MKRLKRSLTCSYCSKIYKDPVELPCDDLTCKEHLIEKDVVKEKKIKCTECKAEFDVRENEFRSNKLAQKQINEQIFLSDEELCFKKKLEESIKLFYQMHDEFISSKNQLYLDCHNHFHELRFQIDEHREKLKAKIDEIYMEMIEETKKYETLNLKNLNEKFEIFLKSNQIKTISEDLKVIEETFRDPQILITTIEEMHFKQQEAIANIQSNLNEIIQIKKDLKASNEFCSNLVFDKDSFGQLNLNEYLAFDPFKSQILTGKQPLELIKLCEFDLKDKFKLLYRASRDGFDSNDFHLKYDGYPNTLNIFKAKGTSFIFGGFTSVAWDVSDQRKSDPNAFLFSLTNKDNKPCKMSIDPNEHRYAICCDSKCGPCFGGGCDICIFPNANANTNSYSNLGHTYKHPQYEKETNKAKSFLAGSQYFQLSEIEVYQKE